MEDEGPFPARWQEREHMLSYTAYIAANMQKIILQSKYRCDSGPAMISRIIVDKAAVQLTRMHAVDV